MLLTKTSRGDADLATVQPLEVATLVFLISLVIVLFLFFLLSIFLCFLFNNKTYDLNWKKSNPLH